MGPNLKRLVIHKMSVDAIPPGGGLANGIEFLTTPGALSSGLRLATEWVDMAIRAIREAAEPNPWKSATEEEIAGELLRQIESRKVMARHQVKGPRKY